MKTAPWASLASVSCSSPTTSKSTCRGPSRNLGASMDVIQLLDFHRRARLQAFVNAYVNSTALASELCHRPPEVRGGGLCHFHGKFATGRQNPRNGRPHLSVVRASRIVQPRFVPCDHWISHKPLLIIMLRDPRFASQRCRINRVAKETRENVAGALGELHGGKCCQPEIMSLPGQWLQP
jgi:hypothetical protein